MAAAAVLLGCLPDRALAAPTSHRLQLGDIEIVVVSDGHLNLVARGLATNASPEQIAAAMARAGQSGDRFQPATNVTVVKAGAETVLIDAGAGPNFMDTAGKLGDNLAVAGIDAASITKVVFTHGHPDHLWGTVDEFDNAPRFPNASYVMSAAEWDLWTSPDAATKLPPDRVNFVPGAQRNLQAIAERMRRIKPGEDIITGLRAVDTGGHTQGHIAIEVAHGNEAVLVLGDALTHPVVSFEHPDWRPASDHEPERGVATRKSLLDRLATDKMRVIGYHLPFPGLGRVERKDAAYRYVAGG